MGFNNFLKSLFGDKSSRDMKLIQPLVEKVKAAYPEIKALDNDSLRARTKEIQKYVQESAQDQKKQIAELKAKIEETPIDEREDIFAQIDKLEKEVLEIYEKALNEVMPVAFSIIKDTARRFAENEEVVVTANDFDRELAIRKDFVRIEGDKAIYSNHWMAGGNDMKWDMVHYDVQLFGGVVLHQGKIAEMATGEGKTLVATLPVFLNALTGNGVHVVTVMITLQNVTLSGWDRSMSSTDYLLTVLTNTDPIHLKEEKHTKQTLHLVQITSLVSTIFVTIWQYRPQILFNELTTMQLSMRLTLC